MFGLAAGGIVLHFPGSYGDLTSWELGPGIFGLVPGAANGVAFGVLLWLAAGGGSAVARRLIHFGMLAVGLTHGLHDASSFRTPYPLIEAASGASVGAETAARAKAHGSDTAFGVWGPINLDWPIWSGREA